MSKPDAIIIGIVLFIVVAAFLLLLLIAGLGNVLNLQMMGG